MGKYIYLFVGKSGSGKTTVADILVKQHNWKAVDSYTTRSQRYEGETGHIFVSEAEFEQLPDKCAYTYFDGHEYCATSQQVDESDIYIIDPAGINYFLKHYKGVKIPHIIQFDASDDVRFNRMYERGDSFVAVKQRQINDTIKFMNSPKADLTIDTDHMTPKEVAALILYRDGVLNHEEI